MINEFREFFLRTVKVFTGSKADQELNYPIDNVVNTCNGKELKYNRLLSQHYASDNVIRKFLSSITFKLNPEDTAKVDEQGLSMAASDEEASTNFIDTSDFTRTLQSHQLPIIINSSGATVPSKYYDLATGAIHNTLADAIASNNKFIKAFIVDGSTGGSSLLFGEAPNPPIEISNNATTPSIQGLVTIDKALHLIKNGDVITYDFMYEFIHNGTETETISVECVISDNGNETSLFLNSVNSNQPINKTFIIIQRTNDNKLFINNGYWNLLQYIPIPTSSTFDIYLKFTATAVASITKAVYISTLCQSKIQ